MNFKIYALFLLITTFKCITSEPIPDTSEQCLSCQNQISEMEDIWTNSKSVEAILKVKYIVFNLKYWIVHLFLPFFLIFFFFEGFEN